MATTGSISRNVQGDDYVLEESVEVDQADVDTNASGDVTVTFANLREILSEGSVQASIETGYTPVVRSVSGNAATIRIYTYTGGNPTAFANQTNVGILHVTARGY